MVRSISSFLSIAVIWMCFITSCGQTPASNRLSDEINDAKVKARHLVEEAERQRAAARDQTDRRERERLLEEAAKLSGLASDRLVEAAKNADEMAKVKSPAWYEEYFSLQSKLITNLAQLATGAHHELLVRKRGDPTESQVQSWKENIDRIRKENEGLRKQISAIESRQGTVLIKE